MNATLLSWLYQQTRGGAPRSSERMARLMQALDLPHPNKVVLVAGTNGKGTVATTLSAALTSAGYQTGTFVSPHIEQFNERISVNGVLIPDNRVAAGISALQARQDTLQAIEPTFFELTLALALAYFSEEHVQFAVIEAGVGVQHDATNALSNIVASVISSVSLDHTNVLGPTTAHIAADKAHAIKPGITTFSGVTDPALQRVFQDRANEVGGTLVTIAPTAQFAPTKAAPELRLAAATARSLGLAEEYVEHVFAAPRLPARRERFTVAGNRTVILDGAHNEAAAKRLVTELPEQYTLLFAALAKKDGQTLLRTLTPHQGEVFSTAADPFETPPPVPGTTFVANPVAALHAALAAVPAGGTLVVAGSFYLAGAVRATLRELQNFR